MFFGLGEGRVGTCDEEEDDARAVDVQTDGRRASVVHLQLQRLHVAHVLAHGHGGEQPAPAGTQRVLKLRAVDEHSVWQSRLGDEHVHDDGVDRLGLEYVLGDHEHVTAPLRAAEQRGLVALGRHEIPKDRGDASAQPEGVPALGHERPTFVCDDTAVRVRVRYATADVDDFDGARRENIVLLRARLGRRVLHNDIGAGLRAVERRAFAHRVRDCCEQVAERRDADVPADAAAIGRVHDDPDASCGSVHARAQIKSNLMSFECQCAGNPVRESRRRVQKRHIQSTRHPYLRHVRRVYS